MAPTYENIRTRRYPVSRSMYICVKNAHVGIIPGLREFIAAYTSERAMGDGGYLMDRGLIVLPAAERNEIRQRAASLTPMERPGS